MRSIELILARQDGKRFKEIDMQKIAQIIERKNDVIKMHDFLDSAQKPLPNKEKGRYICCVAYACSDNPIAIMSRLTKAGYLINGAKIIENDN